MTTEAIQQELSRQQETASELGVPLGEHLVQQLLATREALAAMWEERDQLKSQLFGRYGS